MFILLLTLAVGLLLIAGGFVLAYYGLPQRARSDYYGHPKTTVDRSITKIATGIVVAFFGLLIAIGSGGWSEIGPGQVGIVVNLGKVDSSEISSGLNWRVPIVSSVHIMDTRVQAYQFGGDAQGDVNKPENQGIETFTSENQPAYMYGVVNYSIDPTYAAELYQTVGDDWFTKVVASQAQSEIKQDARQYSVDDITKQRDALARAAQERLQNDVKAYHINITGVFINNIRLSAEYLASVTAKQVAQQNVQTAIANANSARETAKGQADAAVTAANGQAAATVALAAGQATANQSISASLNDNLIRWQQVQKLNPNVQVMIVPDNSNFILNTPTPKQ